jgi:hypothetical protein
MLNVDFDIAPFSGYVYSTDFIFTDITNHISPVSNRFWDFGDGATAYGERAVTHTYKYANNFTVTLSVVDVFGNVNVAQRKLQIDYAVRDQIQFLQIPDTISLPGIPTQKTFKIGVTSAEIKQPIKVMLHSANSRSIPLQIVEEKWRHLTPTWRFTDTNFTPITSITISTAPIFQNNIQVGVHGEGEFFYIDDIGTDTLEGDCSVVIHATLLTNSFTNYIDTISKPIESYANTEQVKASIIWQVQKLLPEFLKITNNLIDDVHPTQWVGAEIPVTLSIHNNKIVTDSNYGVVFSYPSTNDHGNRFSIKLEIEGLEPHQYVTRDNILSLQALDKNGLPAGGIVHTSITPLVTALNTRITGYSYTLQNSLEQKKFLVPLDFPIPQHAWISNTEHNVLNRITILGSGQQTEDDICSEGNIAALNGQQDGQVLTTYVPYLSTTSVINYNLSGVSGVFGLAIRPVTQDLIAVDSETDAIYKYTTDGVLISGIQLKLINDSLNILNYPITAAPSTQTFIFYDSEFCLTPSYISLDRHFNFWVTLYNSVSVLKFNEDLQLRAVVTPPFIYKDAIVQDEKIFKPPVVETDRLNNIWVSYTQTLCSGLFKYSENGNFITSVTLPPSSLPTGIAVTPDNSIWVTNSMHESKEFGTIQKYDTNGTLLATVTGFGRPSFIALDRDANVWFTHGTRNIGFINSVTYQVSSWYVNGAPSSGQFIPIKVPDSNFYTSSSNDEELGGLAVDAANRIWVIDSVYNNVYVLSASTTSVTNNISRRAKVLPDALIGYMPDIRTAFTLKILNKRFKSAQATGDWTGNRWLQKYGDVQYFSGKSEYFSVLNFNENFNLKKINDGFSMAEQYKELALSEHFSKNVGLFDKFLPATVGDALPSNFEDIGEKIYERIANFVSMHADIETCGIEKLMSICASVDQPIDTFFTSFPASIKNAIDLFSVSKERIRGIQDNAPVLSKSVGKVLNTETDMVTAGQKIFLQNKFSSIYTLVNVPKQNNLNVYPLKDFDGVGFAQPVINNYLFYEYIPYTPIIEENGLPVYIENIIDWNNPSTTFSFNISSKNDWYGEDGLVEKVFNYILTKNLKKNS